MTVVFEYLIVTYFRGNLISRELNFAKMERAYFVRLNSRDLAKKYDKNVKNTFSRVFMFAIFLKIEKIAKISPTKISNSE